MQAWLSAFRLRTLPLALSCIFMGAILALRSGTLPMGLFILCCLTTVFLQILSNLANDYGDSVNGADHAQRKGPSRAVQSGAISPLQMRTAIIFFSALCLASGVALILWSFGTAWQSLLFFFVLGLLSITAAITYTMGKRPYGYAGLGDVAVLLFFGLVGVMGSRYLFTHSINLVDVLPALTCGFFSMAVLNVNNVRDIESDRMAGKNSIPVRIGRSNAALYHNFLLAAGLLSTVAYTLLNYERLWQFLFLLVTPLLISNARAVRHADSQKLDPWLKQMALTTLLFVVLFGVGNVTW